MQVKFIRQCVDNMSQAWYDDFIYYYYYIILYLFILLFNATISVHAILCHTKLILQMPLQHKAKKNYYWYIYLKFA